MKVTQQVKSHRVRNLWPLTCSSIRQADLYELETQTTQKDLASIPSFFPSDVEALGRDSFCLPNPGPGLGRLATILCCESAEKSRELELLCVSMVTILVSA